MSADVRVDGNEHGEEIGGKKRSDYPYVFIMIMNRLTSTIQMTMDRPSRVSQRAFKLVRRRWERCRICWECCCF